MVGDSGGFMVYPDIRGYMGSNSRVTTVLDEGTADSLDEVVDVFRVTRSEAVAGMLAFALRQKYHDMSAGVETVRVAYVNDYIIDMADIEDDVPRLDHYMPDGDDYSHKEVFAAVHNQKSDIWDVDGEFVAAAEMRHLVASYVDGS